MMKGDRRNVTGLVRAPDHLPPIDGLPYGDISLAAGELMLQVAGMSEFALFAADSAGPPLMHAQTPGGRWTLQSRDLPAGRALRRVARVNQRDYEGRIRVISAQDESLVRNRLVTARASASPTAAALMRAETLDELDLLFQRDQVMRRAGLR